MLINSGDMFQGSVASNSNYGKLLTDCMDNIGFDSFTYGNHEFDWGLDKVRELSAYAKTPFLGANIYKWDAKTREFGEFASDIAREYTIKQLPNGLKVGIIGVIGKDQITSISSNLVQDIGFKDPREIIPGLSQKLRYEEGCHVVVVSIHAPKNTLFMASSDFDIDDYADAVFCGHSHDNECYITVGGTPFLQGMSNGKMVSHVRLDVTASGEVSCNTYENISYSSSWDSDQSIQQIVDTYAEDYEQMAAQKLGTVDSYLGHTAEMPRLACRAMAEQVIADGSAFEICCKMFAAQGGDTSVLRDASLFRKAKYAHDICAPADGYIVQNDVERIGNASVLLGAGRIKKEDSIDFAAGIIMHKKLGDAVKAGEPICTLYADDDTLFAAAEEMYVGGLTIGAEKPEVPPLIYARVTSEGVERF